MSLDSSKLPLGDVFNTLRKRAEDYALRSRGHARAADVPNERYYDGLQTGILQAVVEIEKAIEQPFRVTDEAVIRFQQWIHRNGSRAGYTGDFLDGENFEDLGKKRGEGFAMLREALEFALGGKQQSKDLLANNRDAAMTPSILGGDHGAEPSSIPAQRTSLPAEASISGEPLYRRSLCERCGGGKKMDPLRCTVCQGHKYTYEPANAAEQALDGGEAERLQAIEKRAKRAAHPWNPISGECPSDVAHGIKIAKYILTGEQA
jgi:hypothetical protein